MNVGHRGLFNANELDQALAGNPPGGVDFFAVLAFQRRTCVKDGSACRVELVEFLLLDDFKNIQGAQKKRKKLEKLAAKVECPMCTTLCGRERRPA